MTRAAVLALSLALCAPALAPHGAASAVPDDFTDELIIGGLSAPVGIAFLPDGRLLVVEQSSGRIRLIVDGALAATDPVAVVPDLTTGGERGLLGIAVDPGWPFRPYVYVHHTTGGQSIRIARFTATGDVLFQGNGSLSIDPSSRHDVLAGLRDVASNHNGGTVRFGRDAMLYVSLGEDATPCAAQDTTALLGVILRLDVSGLPEGAGGPPDRETLVPADNPFATSDEVNRRLVWANGLRNPFRFHVDLTNGEVFIADVGQSRREEIDWARQGGLSFGWPQFEGDLGYPLTCDPFSTPTAPIHTYDQSIGRAVISAGVYRSPRHPTHPFPAEYEGDYFFSDYFGGFLKRLKRTGDTWALADPVPGQPTATRWADGMETVTDYAIGFEGALWYCKQSGETGGEIRRIVPSEGSTSPVERVVLAPPRPTPATGQVTLTYSLPRPVRVRLAVYDIHGRLVRVIHEGVDSGPIGRSWDALDDAGRPVRPGVYVVRLEAGGTVVERKLPLIR